MPGLISEQGRHGRWRRLLTDGLGTSAVVGVAATVEGHLGGPPTRAEMTAARRAAHRLAASGRVELHAVSVDGHRGQFLVITRPGVTISDEDLRRAAVTPQLGRRSKPGLRLKPLLRGTVAQVQAAAAAVPYIDPRAVDAVEAAHLAKTLTDAVTDLAELARRLQRRAHHTSNPS